MTLTPPSPRQTLSYLRNLFAERGIRPKSKLGQSFLIDLNLIDLIIRSAELSRDDLVLEVGSGTGGLTTRLVAEAGAVVSVELDPAFAGLTEEVVPPQEHVVLLETDALKNKNELNPDMIEAMRTLAARTGTTRYKLVANLPYAVAVPLISNLLLSDLSLERMVVTVQWEIAGRLTACPGTKDYGALAVLIQSLTEVELIRQLPTSVFWPRPQVQSAIVRIVPVAEKRAHVGDVLRFRNFLRDLYTHRRKNLRSALSALPGGKRKKAEVDARLGELGISGDCRAETLDLEQHLQLCRTFT
jgi:16S rRNA (adenine1518-N6/adenine1519-N6)-dimethyltransferase